MEFVFWIGFSVGVGYFASTKGRNPVGWGALALLISPLIAVIILAVIKDLETEKKIEDVDKKTDNFKMEMNYNQKFNDYRAEHMDSKINAIEGATKEGYTLATKENPKLLDEKIKCVKCGAEVSTNSKFCSSCGAEIQKEKECSKCHKMIPINSKFCPFCGNNTSSTKCSTCGTENLSDAKFCKDCGEELG